MLNFNKKHLNYNYTWDPLKKKEATVERSHPNLLLDSNDGYMVLSFINSYMHSRNYHALSTFQAIEECLKSRIPYYIRNPVLISEWLDLYFHPEYIICFL